ncbi:uncharacterized protein LOC116803393 [Drosophila sechellia]|uniref:uncharacterized protein LOC116803393 n=1 Tax=Drosophila sechellia TaxID=7238 RepID=UPI0013DE5A85|nr:uncharacterized protein LOC116803393 [Drosophila sechellia]
MQRPAWLVNIGAHTTFVEEKRVPQSASSKGLCLSVCVRFVYVSCDVAFSFLILQKKNIINAISVAAHLAAAEMTSCARQRPVWPVRHDASVQTVAGEEMRRSPSTSAGNAPTWNVGDCHPG